MSSSRILSSRPSASCITAKPIARTIKGRGRNASPFFAAQKLGKLRAFPQSPPGTLLYGSPSREPHGPLPGRCGALGVSIPPHRKWGSRGGFSARAAGGTCALWLCRPGNRTVHSWGAVGHWRFPLPSRKQESRAGFSARACRGHCFMSLRPGNRMAHCRGTGASAPPSRKQGKPRGLSVSACRGHCFIALRPGNRTAHCRALWGYGRFHTGPPGMGAMP